MMQYLQLVHAANGQHLPSSKSARRAIWNRVRLLVLFMMGLSLSAPIALGQQFGPRLGIELGPTEKKETSLQPATEYSPEKVRLHLLAFHGFTRAQLDAASTRVPEILMAWIEDQGQAHLIRRQAIKALRFYPADETFAFIELRLQTAPLPLQPLYLGSLEGFVEVKPAELEAVVGRTLTSESPVVRHAAVSLAGKLTSVPSAIKLLETRLEVEDDPSVRGAILEKLGAN